MVGRGKLPLLLAIVALVIADGALLLWFRSHPGTQPVANAPTHQATTPPSAPTFQLGMYITNPDPTVLEQRIGRKLNILAWFVHWSDATGSQKLSYACTHGYEPLISWESWSGQGTNTYRLADIAAGKYDGLIRDQLGVVRQTCGKQTVLVRLDHEFDTPVGVVSWYPWQGHPTAYIAAWRHVVALGRTIAPNIRWLWSPNRGTATATLYYPGAAYVDAVGLTLNRGVAEPNEATFGQFYEEQQTVIASFGKPIIIGETTYDERIGDKAAWITGMFASVRAHPEITALVWFNGAPWYRYDSSSGALTAFKDGLR